jgi:hypothetical protein
MAEPSGSNGNVLAAPVVGIANEVWNQAAHSIRVDTSGYPPMVSKTVTYAAGANGTGDYDGTDMPDPLFTVSGQVMVAIIGVCSTTLTGAAATLKVGNATTTTRYIPSFTATTLTAGGTVDSTGLVTAGTAPVTTPNQTAFDTESIIATIGTADITAGVITYYCFYRPLSVGATVVAAA